MVRTRVVKVRVSESEYQRMQALAKEAGLPVSTLIRTHVGQLRIRHRYDERQRVALLNRINANLNMIAKWVNIWKSCADAVQVLAQLVVIERSILNLLQQQDKQ